MAAVAVFAALVFAGGVCGAMEQPAQDKTLILYYSRSGNTRAACEALQGALGADIRQIRDVNSRGKGFGIIAGMFKIVLGMQTDTEPASVDFAPYTRLIISAPIWGRNLALAMRTFVERNSFDGKDVIIFVTSDYPVEAKYRQKHEYPIKASGGSVIGYFRVPAAKFVNDEKVRLSREKIVEGALKLVPEITACLQSGN